MSTDDQIDHVSDTALWVAAFRGTESTRPNALFNDPLALVLAGEKGAKLMQSMPYPKILGWLMTVRTIAIDRLIQKAIADGVDTIINLGAGLDTRPYRMDLPLALQWIEIDFPHMIDLKNAKLKDQTPRCALTRIGLDLSNRALAQKTYAELGQKTRKALVITEGVIVYLTNQQASDLAEDLKAVPSFAYWIQDYRRTGLGLRRPKKLGKSLKNAPFRFEADDPIAFFEERGWHLREDVLATDVGQQIGRKFPLSFPWNIVVKVMPKERQERFRKLSGFALFSSK